MKIFRTIGILSVLLLFVSAFLPWVNVSAQDVTYTGLRAGRNGTWAPAVVAWGFAILYLVTMFIPKLWVKMLGVFCGVVVVAWSFSVYYRLRGTPLQPQEMEIGLYLFLLASLGIIVSALIPYIPDKYRKD